MAVEKAYRCDLCGELVHRDALRRLGIRTMDDRPEDADNVDVGPCCYGKPITDALLHANRKREMIANGTPAPV